MRKVVLYTKPGCCLCETVKAQLQKLRARRPFDLLEVNILEDKTAFAEFHEQIPVIFIDGRKAFKYHLDEQEFLRRLSRPSAQGDRPQDGT